MHFLKEASLSLSLFSGRRNPLRMLSNAMDFRGRRRNTRPKSAECSRGGVNGDPAGGTSGTIPYSVSSGNGPDAAYLISQTSKGTTGGSNPRLLMLATNDSFDQYNLSSSRHSLPNLDPLDLEVCTSLSICNKPSPRSEGNITHVIKRFS